MTYIYTKLRAIIFPIIEQINTYIVIHYNFNFLVWWDAYDVFVYLIPAMPCIYGLKTIWYCGMVSRYILITPKIYQSVRHSWVIFLKFLCFFLIGFLIFFYVFIFNFYLIFYFMIFLGSFIIILIIRLIKIYLLLKRELYKL